MVLLTGQMLKNVVPNIEINRANEIATAINEVCPKYKINTPDLLHEFLANLIHESGAFRIKSEGLNYTTAARLVAVWPSRFNLTGTGGKKNAKNFVKNSRALANEVYNGRMGNRPGTDDGYNFRGGGFIQLTGRENYQLYSNYCGNTLPLEQFAELIRTNDKQALDSACWFFAIYKNLLTLAVGNANFTTIVKRINGGTIGLDDRQKYFELCKKFIK